MLENKKILAFDTSSKSLSVAILDGNRVIAEEYMSSNRNHAPYLVPMIQHLLDFTETKVTDIDVFATTIGPGSFTGLRIGIATIKGFCDTLVKPMYGVVSLEALAQNLVSYQGIIVPMLDARKNQVYGTIYDNRNGEMVRKLDFSAFNPTDDEIVAMLSSYDEIGFIGDGVLSFHDELLATYGERAKLYPSSYNIIQASNIGILANRVSESDLVYDLIPFYLRGVEAVPKYKEYLNE